ncbi:hypothetical protein GOEFS_015_00490 [Gordonia effusa NBRC 100432]|uniref:Integral membrane protein n=1 Tax=Gordonia effusa NBRC 100432 TaxID=1077974 RepID=H0QVH5_9ACTN|nr:hypothetical protein [Gordonia effusa]GAB16852.1 hypothetical protein GOEFS_015_00490 [Gordonia effusa NBRC 100432]
MIVGVLFAVLAALAYGTASVLQARGAQQVSDLASPPTLRSTLAAILTVSYLAGMALDGLGFVGTLVSARLIPLFLSQTIMSANLIVTALLGIIVLGTRLRPRDWAAIGVVVAALLLLGVAAGDEGHKPVGAVMHWSVLIIGIVVLAVGVALVRWLGARVAVIAGLGAGALFGLMAIAVRILDGVDPLDVGQILGDPAAYGILVGGIGGFYLFTVALQTGSVNGAAAALVVGETVIPGIVGIALLGDTTRAGWGAVAVIAFIAAVVGAVVVAVSGAAAT